MSANRVGTIPSLLSATVTVELSRVARNRRHPNVATNCAFRVRQDPNAGDLARWFCAVLYDAGQAEGIIGFRMPANQPPSATNSEPVQ